MAWIVVALFVVLSVFGFVVLRAECRRVESRWREDDNCGPWGSP